MKLILIAAFVATSRAFLFGKDTNWNGLRVTWGPNPFKSPAFDKLPRTIGEAKKAGFSPDTKSCNPSNGFMGTRYIKNRDTAVMLLFDRNGYIAGIQAGVPRIASRRFPSQNIAWFISDNDMYTVTAYFTPPGLICSQGRTAKQYEDQGTGTGLWIQTGKKPATDFIKIAHNEADISNEWTKGLCFPTMGQHYWYNLKQDMNCDDFHPVFLLYNKGKLNAFGWAFNADLTSSRYEHPPKSVIKLFMKQPPTCLLRGKVLSTMHIYLDNTPHLNLCL